MIDLDAASGQLTVDADLTARPAFGPTNQAPQRAFARPLFSALRAASGSAESGGGLSPLET